MHEVYKRLCLTPIHLSIYLSLYIYIRYIYISESDWLAGFLCFFVCVVVCMLLGDGGLLLCSVGVFLLVSSKSVSW
jgi:hypothetical protein